MEESQVPIETVRHYELLLFAVNLGKMTFRINRMGSGVPFFILMSFLEISS